MLVCASSSTSATCGLRARMASMSISSKIAPLYSIFLRGTVSSLRSQFGHAFASMSLDHSNDHVFAAAVPAKARSTCCRSCPPRRIAQEQLEHSALSSRARLPPAIAREFSSLRILSSRDRNCRWSATIGCVSIARQAGCVPYIGCGHGGWILGRIYRGCPDCQSHHGCPYISWSAFSHLGAIGDCARYFHGFACNAGL